MDVELTEEQQQENIRKVIGTTVIVYNEKTDRWSRKTAKILNYCSPLVWKLDRSIYGWEYYHDNHVRTTDGRRLYELV